MSKQTNDFQQLITLLMQLLTDGEVVESKMFPDPDTDEPREVDIYVLIKGGLPDGRRVTIAVECIAWSRKADAPWVEKMYGKHCRLQAADIVLLVSEKGFYNPAVKKAKAFGYQTIHPNIKPKALSKVLSVAGDLQVGFKMAMVDFGPMTMSMGVQASSWLQETVFYRPDGSILIPHSEYQSLALVESFKDADGTIATWWASPALNSERTVEVDDPHHDSVPLCIKGIDHSGAEFLTEIRKVSFTAKVAASEQQDIVQTHQGDFGGAPFGTGTTTFQGKPARLAVTEDENGNWRSMSTWEYEPPAESAK